MCSQGLGLLVMMVQQHAPAKGISPLVKRVVRGLFQIIGGLGIGLLVAVLLVAWRLASGPVSISFLTPYIKTALSEVHKDAIALDVEDTILTWAGWERTLDIRIVNLRTSLPDGQVIATVPELSLSLSAKALLKGNVAPRSIEFFGPTFHVERMADGSFDLGFEQEQQISSNNTDLVGSLILLMMQDPNPDQALSYLKRISVVDGQVIYEDKAEGSLWQASQTSADFTRVDGGLEAELDMTLKGAKDTAVISVMGTYTVADKRVDLGVRFDGLVPADFTEFAKNVPMLSVLDVPLNGTLALSMNQDGFVEGVDFDLRGGAGHIALPVGLAAEHDLLPWAQRLKVDSLSVKGRFEGGTETLQVNNMKLTLPQGERFHIPSPVNHDYEIRELQTELSFYGDQGLLDVRALDVLLGQGVKASLSALVDGLGQGQSGMGFDIKGQTAEVAFNDLDQLWPKSLGIDARDWVVPNLRDGVAHTANIEVSLNVGEDGTIQLDALSGELTGSGITVDYLAPMPPVTQAVGRATFDANAFNITVSEGIGHKGVRVTGGTIDLVKLQEDTAEAHIDLSVNGPAQGMLELIDYEPLGFASELGIKPSHVGGMAQGKVKLSLPLLLDLKAKDVEAQASATVTKGSIKEALFEKDLSNGDLQLSVDNDGLALNGEAILGNVPIELDWKHDFRDAALFRDRYELSGTIDDVLNLDALGIEVPDILSRYMAGGAEANVKYTEFSNGTQALSARVDLSNISLAAPELGWAKPTGVPGTAELELRLKDDTPSEIPKFGVTAPDMDIAGSAVFADDGALLRIDLNTMKSGHTDVSGSLTPDVDGSWELVLRGNSLDAELLWDEMLGIHEAPPRQKLEDDELSLTVAVDIRSLRIRQGRALNDLVGTVYRENGGWRKIDVGAGVGDSGAVELLLDTDMDGLRYLSITSDDAGSTLHTLDLYDNISGGNLDLKAAYTSPDKDAPLEGVLKVTDYAMIDAPMFARLIGVMSLTGVLDALQGDGLNFDIFEAPFKLQGGQLELVSSRASGPTIGVTASGTVDMDNKRLNFNGTVVPAYAINALLGKIPLIGDLFTGGEKGGGLFAATYTMVGTEENVEITVNPLSVLTPGVLRGIFSGSRKESDIPTTPPVPKSAPVEPVTPAPVN